MTHARLVTSVLLLLLGTTASAAEPPKIRVLLLTGLNNHNWKETTPVLREALESTGRFAVTVADKPTDLAPASLAGQDVILSNFNTFTTRTTPPHEVGWTDEFRKAYADFVRNGKGHVAVHAGSASFGDWADYQALALGTFVIGRTSHGRIHAFPVTPADVDHPILTGVAPFETTDELWHGTVFQPGATVLATAFSSKASGGSGKAEPVLAAGHFGRGRSAFLVLGHDARAMRNPGFVRLLLNSTEWAATGSVTAIKSPPAAAPADLAAILAAARVLEPGDDRTPLLQLADQVAAARDKDAQRAIANAICDSLKSPGATAEGRRRLLGLLKLVATADHVPSVAPLLADATVSMAARDVLEAIPGDAATGALRSALARATGDEATALAASLAVRSDPVKFQGEPPADSSQPDPSAPLAARIADFRKANDPARSAAFAAELKDVPAELQPRLLGLLLDQPHADALPVFTKYAASDHPLVRSLAIRGIGLVGDASAVPPLLALAAKATGREQDAIQSALAVLKGDRVDDALVRALTASDQVPAALIRAIADRQVTAARPALLAIAAGPDDRAAAESAKALADLATASDVPALIALLEKHAAQASREPALRAALASVLKRTGGDTGPVVAAYDRASPEFRKSLLAVVASVGNDASLTFLRLQLASPDPAARRDAVRALANWPTASALPDLLVIAEAADAPEKILALRGAARLVPLDAKADDAAKAGLLARFCALAPNPAARGPVLAALGDVPCPESLAVLAGKLTDPNDAPSAASAIVRIAPRVTAAPGLRPALEAITRGKLPDKTREAARQLLADLPSVSARDFRFVRSETALALTRGDQTVWQFNFDPADGKPGFAPLAPVGGPDLAWRAPADHVWHYGHWFSWKYINKLNYWEEDARTRRGQGHTRWSTPDVVTRPDGSATLTIDLTYAPAGKPAVLSERRTLAVSAPRADGSYTIDWALAFTAGDEDLTFDRTPPPGQPGGAANGGYAGLSVRFRNPTAATGTTLAGPAEFNPQNRHRSRSPAFDYALTMDGKTAGAAILDHPDNPNAPTPWYAIRSDAMSYVNAAVICDQPLTLKARQGMTLRYRVIVHPGTLTAEQLTAASREFK